MSRTLQTWGNTQWIFPEYCAVAGLELHSMRKMKWTLPSHLINNPIHFKIKFPKIRIIILFWYLHLKNLKKNLHSPHMPPRPKSKHDRVVLFSKRPGFSERIELCQHFCMEFCRCARPPYSAFKKVSSLPAPADLEERWRRGWSIWSSHLMNWLR